MASDASAEEEVQPRAPQSETKILEGAGTTATQRDNTFHVVIMGSLAGVIILALLLRRTLRKP